MKKRYRIAFLTSFDPNNKRKLSGSPYYIMTALQDFVGDVTNLGPVVYGQTILNYMVRFFRLFNRPYNLNHSYFYAFYYRQVFSKRLKGKSFDFIFAPRASTQIALLKTSIPIIYYSDTTFKSMYNYYSWFSNFCRLSEIEGNSIERKALNKAEKVILSSEWAANSVIHDYHIKKSKIHIVPFGPNVDYIPKEEEIFKSKSREVCKLLFIGAEWERKGGKIAYDTLLELKKRGISVELTIVGVIPPDNLTNDSMTIIPFLDKNIKSESDKFNQLLLENHFLILPTREECFGVVFCEASAYGLPSLSYNTGGVSSAIKNNMNGFLFDLSAEGGQFADKIAEYFLDYNQKYLNLSKSSRLYYNENLSWETFGKSILKIFNDI